MKQSITPLILGALIGSLITILIYSRYMNEVQLKDFVLLYSKKSDDLYNLKEKSNDEIVCLNYILTKGDIEILRSTESVMPIFFFSKESKEVIEKYNEAIKRFEQINPQRLGCNDNSNIN